MAVDQRRRQRFCNTEIRNGRRTCGEKNVSRLDVPMNYAVTVSKRERTRDVAKNCNGIAYTLRPRTPHVRSERFAIDIRHHEVRHAIHFAGAQNPHDVWMLKLCDRQYLAAESLRGNTERELLRQHLSLIHISEPTRLLSISYA